MAFSLPTDLICQVQSALRTDAGLSTYDPDDPSLPALPSLDALIAGIDSSLPADLWCRKCEGKLLRGMQSVICIYCGKKQQDKDFPPHPISFDSTVGYQWLLQSLDLDQSEIVGPSAEEFKSHRGRSTPKEKISLHELLDLEITWPDDSGNPDASITNKALEQRSSPLNLTGADLDSIFLGSQTDVVNVASEEPVVAKKNERNESKASIGEENLKASIGEENLSLFSSVPSADLAVRSSEDNSGVTFSGWVADFQSASKHDVPASDRIDNAQSKVEEPENGYTTSQMHDLSFMLENHLSVPTNPN